MRVPGHGLQREGRAHDADGRYTGNAVGYGLCQCGATSDKVDTDAARKRWHVRHKAELLATRKAESATAADRWLDEEE